MGYGNILRLAFVVTAAEHFDDVGLVDFAPDLP
jgi:hypothetical protein